MKKKTKKKIAKELLLLSVRMSELKDLKRQTSSNVYKIKNVCGYSYSHASSSISSLNLLISEIDLKMKSHRNRCKKLATDLIKGSGLIFEESPKDVVPYSKIDLQRGYIILNRMEQNPQVDNDRLQEYVLILESGNIVSKENIIARSVLEDNFQYKDNYTKKQVAAMSILATM